MKEGVKVGLCLGARSLVQHNGRNSEALSRRNSNSSFRVLAQFSPLFTITSPASQSTGIFPIPFQHHTSLVNVASRHMLFKNSLPLMSCKIILPGLSFWIAKNYTCTFTFKTKNVFQVNPRANFGKVNLIFQHYFAII